MKGKTVLVVGGAGFIGCHLSDALLELENKVVVVDNLSLGRRENLAVALENPSFTFLKGDVLDMDFMDKVFQEHHFDFVFDLVANSDISKSFANPSVDLNSTFMTTFNILMLMKKYEVKNLMFASTSAVYGDMKGEMVKEASGPLFPISHYGAGKLASEAFIASFVENYNMKAWITRFPNVCGERATHGVLYDFINKLRKNPAELQVLGDGRQSKPYIYVKELVSAILFICDNSADKINCFNIGGMGQTTVSSIAKMVIEEMQLSAEIKYTGGRAWVGDVPKFAYNLEKIHELGWVAKYSSDEAVRLAIKKILENDVCN